MKISELFEANILPPSGKISPDEIEDVKKVIVRVKQSDTYQEMLKVFDDVTRPISLRNGTLSFKPRDNHSNLMTQNVYKVSRNGQIRITNDSTRMPQQARLSSPLPFEDLYTTYINALEAILKKYKSRIRSAERKVDISQNEDSIENVQIPKDVTSITINGNPRLRDLIGCPEKINGSMLIRNASRLTSLKGAPLKVKMQFRLEQCHALTSLEGIPQYVGSMYLSDLHNITSLSRIDELVKACNGSFFINEQCTSSILGLLKIPGIDYISTTGGYSVNNKTGLQIAVSILNKHLKHKNLLACQEELMDNGLKEYAKF